MKKHFPILFTKLISLLKKLFSRWRYFVVAVASAGVVLFAPNFIEGFFGAHYNPVTNVIVCKNYEECLHESGHRMDHELGDPSRSEDFQEAVHINSYINFEYPELRTPFTLKMATFPGIGSPRLPMQNKVLFGEFSLSGGWGGYGELYASMVEWSMGDINRIPENYRRFFDFNLLKAILARTGYAVPAIPPASPALIFATPPVKKGS